MSKKTILFFFIFVAITVFGGRYFLLSKKTSSNNTELAANITSKNYAQSENSLDDPYLGNKDAKITIVEFADFECPYCQQEFSVLRELASLYPQIKIIYRDFPLIDIHPNALSAAMAANCAHQQDKFWPFHDQLYLNQSQLGEGLYLQIAERVGLNKQQFSSCLKEKSVQEEIGYDAVDANLMSVAGTPTFFVNGKKIAGVISLEVWKSIIDKALMTTK